MTAPHATAAVPMPRRDPAVLQRIGFQGLSCLMALVSERSVTRAAENLQMSQPAMSNTLARLREALNDPLLVRTARGMEPTPYALEVAEAVRLHVRGLESALAQQPTFTPSTATGHVRIATADSNVPVLRPFMAALRRQAPGLRLTLRLPDFAHVSASLADGECDLALGYFPVVAAGLRRARLLSQMQRCIVSRSHPRIRGDAVTLDDYTRELHVGFSSPLQALPTGDEALNAALSRLGHSRTVGAWLGSPLLYGEMVADTDLIATVGELLAGSFAATLPLRVLPLPFEVPPLEISMVWHERTHRSGLFRWVRQLLRETVGTSPDGEAP